VQVGANDGVTVDPVYPFAMHYKDSTSVLLIEPQNNVIELLRKNYIEHPSAKIANVAVSATSKVTLYRIRPELQKYYTGIIGSGVTSENKSYVERKAVSQLPKKLIKREFNKGNNLTESFEMNSMTLMDIIKTQDFSKDIDWLQVDTEGYDDIVIYHSDIETTKPCVISYDKCTFLRRKKAIFDHLSKKSGI